MVSSSGTQGRVQRSHHRSRFAANSADQEERYDSAGRLPESFCSRATGKSHIHAADENNSGKPTNPPRRQSPPTGGKDRWFNAQGGYSLVRHDGQHVRHSSTRYRSIFGTVRNGFTLFTRKAEVGLDESAGGGCRREEDVDAQGLQGEHAVRLASSFNPRPLY